MDGLFSINYEINCIIYFQDITLLVAVVVDGSLQMNHFDIQHGCRQPCPCLALVPIWGRLVAGRGGGRANMLRSLVSDVGVGSRTTRDNSLNQSQQNTAAKTTTIIRRKNPTFAKCLAMVTPVGGSSNGIGGCSGGGNGIVILLLLHFMSCRCRM